MSKNIPKNFWSLNLNFDKKKLDNEMQNYLKVCVERIGFIPNVIKANATDNKRLKAFSVFYNRLMVDENRLTKLEKEMIAVVVSSINRCFYCLISHGAAIRKLTKNSILAEKLVINYRIADISKKHKCMLTFANKLTIESYLIQEDDRNNLRKEGFNDQDILEIVEVTSFFNMTNRIASGTEMMPNEEYHNMDR